MADDKKQEDWKSRQTPPKKPRHHSSSGEETGPPEQPPPQPPPSKTPVKCHKQTQTELQINADVRDSLDVLIDVLSGRTRPKPPDFSGTASAAGPHEARGLPSGEAQRTPPKPKDATMEEASSSAPTVSESPAKPIHVPCLLAQRSKDSEVGSITALPIEEQPRATTSAVAAPGGSGWKERAECVCHCLRTCGLPTPVSSHHTSVEGETPIRKPRVRSQYSRPEPHPDSLKVEELTCYVEEDEPDVQSRKSFSSQGVNTMYTLFCKRQIQMHAQPLPTPPVQPAQQSREEQPDEPEEKMDEDNDGESAP
ncbi:hypothetical protein MTO96_022811 [Rhipicephalus appendiculatus]